MNADDGARMTSQVLENFRSDYDADAECSTVITTGSSH